MPVTALGIADLLVTTMTKWQKLKFTDLMSDYQNTIALKRIFKKEKTTIEDGAEVQFQVIHSTNGSARHVPLGYVANVDIPNVMTSGKMPWRHTHWNWAVERRLIQMNSGGSKIVDIAMTQRMAAMGDAILLFERTLWRVPVAGSDEEALNPVGIPFFVVKSATAATDANADGFNGNVPAGYTTVAGINPTTYLRWRNYSDAYVDVSKPDLIKKMRRAMFKIDFMPLVDGMPTYETGKDYGIYSTYTVVQQMEELLEAQNENLGNDLASKDGLAMFRRVPITPVKQLDEDTTNPIYILDWNTLGAMGLKNEWMHEEHFASNPNQPTIAMTVTDCTWNMWCRNRRKNAVISNGTTMPL